MNLSQYMLQMLLFTMGAHHNAYFQCLYRSFTTIKFRGQQNLQLRPYLPDL